MCHCPNSLIELTAAVIIRQYVFFPTEMSFSLYFIPLF
uniref:Uncharacterized protein n=1 Tax=Anguilla anguilla TaxID=7936 RepID=A0A0E9T3R4_ANGAN